jgi:hypothetical protein
MPFILLSGLLLLVAYASIGSVMAIWILAASQLALLAGEIKKRQVTGAGAFIFMSFLFFGVRPIYLVLENDNFLFVSLYRIRVETTDIGNSMWWATLALLVFAVGAYLAPRVFGNWLKGRQRKSRAIAAARPVVGKSTANGLLVLQVVTLGGMVGLAKFGRSLYGSALGAYAYDVPVPMQAVHIFSLVVLLERWLRQRSAANTFMLIVSGCLFLYFTWLMREVSAFRGFYITGVMVAGIAVLMRLKGRVSYAWLIIPIVGLQPFFQYLGGDRYSKNAELAEAGIVEEVFDEGTIGAAYWKFYDSRGDMNIFDTFVAAQKSEPAFYPYLWSWAYVPLHLVPRALWNSKPKQGITQDVSFTNKAPTSPGIAGFFLLDGGLAWMLLSMLVLGFLVSLLDWSVLTMRAGYLQCCLIGIVTVNAMFLTRFFLWQYFYQVLYAAMPCMLLAWYVGRNANRIQASGRRASGARSAGVFRGYSA